MRASDAILYMLGALFFGMTSGCLVSAHILGLI